MICDPAYTQPITTGSSSYVGQSGITWEGALEHKHYDLIIIGGGSAGLSAARFAAKLGVHVAIIERDRLGGDCAWVGCLPSKTLLNAAKLALASRQADRFGLERCPSPPDLAALLARVRAVIAEVPEADSPEELKRRGVKVVFGEARFLDAHSLAVGERRLTGRRFVICTGASPAVPGIPDLGGTSYHTYASIFDLDYRPRRMIVIGAGPTGVELAQAFGRLGVKVTLIERAERLLSVADPAASLVLTRVFQREGIDVQLRATVEQVAGGPGDIQLVIDGDVVRGDLLLVATGRRPNIADLDLDRADVATSAGAITVDRHLRTSQPHIYAAGDVTGAIQVSHYAALQGFVAARNALLPGNHIGVRESVPWAVFTDPIVAQAGLTEDEARQHERRVSVIHWPVSRIDRAQTMQEADGFIKVMQRPNGRLIGATVVASEADELVNQLQLAIDRGVTTRELAWIMQVYPSFGTGIQELSAESSIAQLTSGVRGRLIRWLAQRALRR